jgi:hypothetical protein
VSLRHACPDRSRDAISARRGRKTPPTGISPIWPGSFGGVRSPSASGTPAPPARRPRFAARCPEATPGVHEVGADGGEVLRPGGEHGDPDTPRLDLARLALEPDGDQPPEPPFQAGVGAARGVHDEAGHRRQHVDLVEVDLGQQVQRRGGVHATIDVVPSPDDRRPVPAGDGAGRDHRLGQRRGRRSGAAERDPPPGVVVDGHDPGLSARRPPLPGGPGDGGSRVGRGPGEQAAHQALQGAVPGPSLWHQRAGGHPGMHPVGGQRRAEQQPGRADPHPWQRRQRPAGIAVDLAEGRQERQRRPALVLHDVVDGDAAAQRGGHHAAGAGAHDQVQRAQRVRQPPLQRGQRSGHPGGAEHAAGAEHQAGPGAARQGSGCLSSGRHRRLHAQAALSSRRAPPAKHRTRRGAALTMRPGPARRRPWRPGSRARYAPAPSRAGGGPGSCP